MQKMMRSKMTAFGILAGLVGIIAGMGWALETCCKDDGVYIKGMSLFVIIVTSLFSVYFIISAYIANEKAQEISDGYILSHKITHQLRNSITALQDLEFHTLRKISLAQSEEHLSDIIENDELKRDDIFKKLGAKIADAVACQVKNNFACNGFEETIRATIKGIIPEGSNQLDWKVITTVVDRDTWAKENREYQAHIIKDNTDFYGILTGDEKFFVENDLAGLADDKYKNSSLDWRKRYNATMVVPIKNKPDGKENVVYYGFLTIDFLNSDKKLILSKSEESPVLNILAHAADAMAVWFVKNDNHEKTLEYQKGHKILEGRSDE